MKALIQRVRRAGVLIDGKPTSRIGQGYLVLVGVRLGDTEDDARYLARKTANLRIFADSEGKMNRSIQEARGEALVVSQFTLYADTTAGYRPSFTGAAPADAARPLYEAYVEFLRGALGEQRVQTGEFGREMLVELENDGPVTIEICTDGPACWRRSGGSGAGRSA